MINYNPKDWWKLILSFHKSDTFRMMLPGILGMAAYTSAVVYLEKEVLEMHFGNTINIHSLVGFVLSLLLVFRTNSAYDRWWEGRKLWGSFVNNARNLSIKLSVLVTDEATRKTLRILITNYVIAAKEHLRNGVKIAELEPCEKYTLEEMTRKGHIPNQLMKLLMTEVNILVKNGQISPQELLFINNELQSFTDNLGACERIKKTPIPYSYSIFIKKIIVVYIASMPFGFAMEFSYWSVLIVALLYYVFGSLELIAEEIEDPFGKDDNDLPTDQITSTIQENLKEIFAN